MATRQPIAQVRQVIIADPPLAPTLGELRASLKYVDIVRMCDRALRAAQTADPATAEIAKGTLRHVRDMADYPQARSLAALYLKILDKPKEGPAA